MIGAMSPNRAEAQLASELRVVVGQLVRRLRTVYRFSLSQASVLGRLDRSGPMGISDLAAAERVRPQSMAQTIKDLERDGLVARRADPTDGRRALIELTHGGLAALHEDRRTRESWIAEAIADDLSADEQATLREAIVLLGRVADRDD
jgi:DNA-binding MarR family transcriptional regulator